MTFAHLNDEQFALLFDFHRSVRYHDSRRAFFELLHRITNVLTILLAGNILFVLATPSTAPQPWWMSAMALVGALMSAFDLVVGYATKAALHAELRNSFSDLEIKVRESDGSAKSLRALERRRLEVEQREPPIYRALDAACHNEVVRAFFDRDQHQRNCHAIGRFPMLTRHLLRWTNIGSAS